MSAKQDSTVSCVETPAAPEWLSKLENRREKLARSKLGHEVGAGAPCNECGDKCPGLDLHFWRKVCRNCKCRKDQHLCTDDDLTGWAQFEILGQIRSKPAFIKIKALSNQPIQLEWIPPNTAPDVVSDYMDKLGTTKIPVAGSDAAFKRKQQLEFQVPPHDLDAALCDNLTESEANQLQQYVQKIRENCVGQGSVVRVGNLQHAVLGNMLQSNVLDSNLVFKPEHAQVFASLNETPVADPILSELFSSEKLIRGIVSEQVPSFAKLFIAFTEPIAESPEFMMEPMLSKATKEKLCGLNQLAVHNLVKNGHIYDKILAALKEKNLDVSRDPKLGPIADFRKEYKQNPQFHKEINALYSAIADAQPDYCKPVETIQNDFPFNSPLPIKNVMQARFAAQIRQDTPMRKVKFGSVSTVVYDCGLPSNIDYERDPIFAQILNSEPLKKAFQNVNLGGALDSVVVTQSPMLRDYISSPTLTEGTKQELAALGVDTKAIQSSIMNAPFYDCLFKNLAEKDINYDDCKLLAPLEKLHSALLTNKPLREELNNFACKLPGNAEISYAKQTLSGSNSNDSGFDSKPNTPNNGGGYADEINVLQGKFSSIPGIEDMNMYPTVEPINLPRTLQNLHIKDNEKDIIPSYSAPLLNCRDCEKNINFGDVAVKAERAGKEIAWHPECFKCHTCRELLADLVYFFNGGQVYCGRDLAIKLKIPRCKACDELIFTKEYTAAENATFHIKHFCCFQCDEPLAGQQYIPDEKTNMPLCLKCYDDYFAASCQRCRQPIGPSDQGVVWGEIHWHGSCFSCAGANCNKSLIGGRFCVKQNMPFCSPNCVRSIIQ